MFPFVLIPSCQLVATASKSDLHQMEIGEVRANSSFVCWFSLSDVTFREEESWVAKLWDIWDIYGT
jgi:hypothetical protein